MGEAHVSSVCRVEGLVQDARDLQTGERRRPENNAKGLQ